jgi:hypothetical protein
VKRLIPTNNLSQMSDTEEKKIQDAVESALQKKEAEQKLNQRIGQAAVGVIGILYLLFSFGNNIAGIFGVAYVYSDTKSLIIFSVVGAVIGFLFQEIMILLLIVFIGAIIYTALHAK